MKRIATAALALGVFAAFVLPASATGSSDVSSYYFTTVYNGQIQCAWGRAYASNSGAVFTSVGNSEAKKGIYCVNAFTLPAGWVGLDLRAQRSCYGGAWQDLSGGMSFNTTASHQKAKDYYTVPTAGCVYRTVSGHQIAVGGGWQYGLTVSGVV